jgi:predicted HTH transcriptional regulator
LIHASIREALANALIHADYYGTRGIVIDKTPDSITISNPGNFRIPIKEAIAGGISDARNSRIFNLFSLIEVGERSGMGLCNLFNIWEKNYLMKPVVTESIIPTERVAIKLMFVESDFVRQTSENVRQDVRQKGEDVRQEKVTQSATQERDNVTQGDIIVIQENDNVRQGVRQKGKDVRQGNATQSVTQERDNVTQGDTIVTQENKDVRQDVRYTRKNSVLDKNLSNLIIDKIKSNNKIRLNEIAIEAGVSERTIRRYIKSMPNVKYIGSGYSGHWEIV